MFPGWSDHALLIDRQITLPSRPLVAGTQPTGSNDSRFEDFDFAEVRQGFSALI